jgi:hypothetical protein
VVHSRNDGASWSESRITPTSLDDENAPRVAEGRGYVIGDYQGLANNGSTFRSFLGHTNSGNLANARMCSPRPWHGNAARGRTGATAAAPHTRRGSDLPGTASKPWEHLSVPAVVLPTDLVGSLVHVRRLENAADTLAHRRAAEAAMNRLLAAALAAGWTGLELGSVLGTTARNVYMRAQRGRRLGDRFGLALPAGSHTPMRDGRLHPVGSML